MKNIRAFLLDESGATAIEYAIMAAGIALTIVAAISALGTAVSGKFTLIKNSVQ